LEPLGWGLSTSFNSYMDSGRPEASSTEKSKTTSCTHPASHWNLSQGSVLLSVESNAVESQMPIGSSTIAQAFVFCVELPVTHIPFQVF